MEKYDKWLSSKNVLDKDKKIIIKMSNKDIKKAFAEPLLFGTAGIRVPMGIGSSLLNHYTIKMIAFAWIKSLENNYPEVLKKGLIIAHDTRNNGKLFSFLVAQVISGMGYKAFLYKSNGVIPTPLVSYTIRKLNLGGGACITASHNPPIFNGIKCFAEQGQHLMAKRTNLISNEMRIIDINTNIPSSVDNIEYLHDDIENKYLQSIKDVIKIDKKLLKDLKIVFSPQHGASYKLGPKILRSVGFEVHEVELQSVPDGNFTHTPDPNPENPASFNEMIELGKKIDAELLLTTDPDGDRVAVGALHHNKYYLFNGHEMASIIVDFFLNKISNFKNIRGEYLIKTIVTTSLIDDIAKKYHVNVQNTLTGYKFIGDAILKNKLPPLMATEESYGSSLCPTISLDKDAMQLLPIVAEAAQFYKNNGKTLVDALYSIYKEHDYFIHYNSNTVLKGKEAVKKLDKLMNDMSKLTAFGSMEISKINDFRKGIKFFEKTNLVIVHFKDNSWIAVRSSGTESLIRKYFCIRGKTKLQAEAKHQSILEEFKKMEKA